MRLVGSWSLYNVPAEPVGGGGVAEVTYDKRDQLEKIQAGLLPGEMVEAVFDMKGGGTGFIGITSKRVIVYDKAFLRKMKAVVSIPYSRIATVAAEDEAGLFTGRGWFGSSKMVLTTSHGDFEFEFRGADKAHLAHDMILGHILCAEVGEGADQLTSQPRLGRRGVEPDPRLAAIRTDGAEQHHGDVFELLAGR